jgi:acyl-CoA oxidase
VGWLAPVHNWILTIHRYMPPTTPCGVPTVAVVFARLIVGKEDRGIKPFLVHLHDGQNMNDGIVTRWVVLHFNDSFGWLTSKRQLPPRGGAHSVGHALTYFNHVRLPSRALLGNTIRAADQKAAFFDQISRVVVGTMSMGFFAVSAMRIASAVAALYSMRRMVTNSMSGRLVPIISFSTQQIPVIAAIAQAHVLAALMDDIYLRFVDSRDSANKHLYAAIFKTTAFQCVNMSIPELCNRCGAQGLFGVNQMSTLLVSGCLGRCRWDPMLICPQADMQGAAVAEGDILGISISKSKRLRSHLGTTYVCLTRVCHGYTPWTHGDTKGKTPHKSHSSARASYDP